MTNVIIVCVQWEAGRVLSRLYIFQVGCVCFFFYFVFHFCLINVPKLKHLSQPGQHGRLLHCLMSPGSGQLYDFLMYECTTGHAPPSPSPKPPPPSPATPIVLLQLWSLTVSFCRTEMLMKGKWGVGGVDGWRVQGGQDDRFQQGGGAVGCEKETTLELHDHCETFGSTLMIYFFMEGGGEKSGKHPARRSLALLETLLLFYFFLPRHQKEEEEKKKKSNFSLQTVSPVWLWATDGLARAVR